MSLLKRLIFDCECVCVAEGRSLALHSPDGVHSCVLRATDSQEAATWFNTLHSALHLLTLKALHEANRTLASLALELHHIGWLSRRQVLEVSTYINIL